MEPPLKKRKISHDVEGWLSVDILPAELIQIIINKIEYDLRTIVRLSRTCTKWLQNIWQFVSHLDVTNGQPQTAPKLSQYQIQPLLERIDCSHMRSLIFTSKVSITAWLLKDKCEFSGSNKFWVWEYMERMTRLESLTMISINLPEQFFEMCSIFTNLSSLILDCSNMSYHPQFMDNITCLTALRHLSFGDGVRSTRALEKLSNLVSLHLPSLPALNYDLVTRLTQLRSLHVDRFAESFMKQVITMTNLRTFIGPGLNLYEPIKEMPNLEYLKVKSVRVTFIPHNLTYLSTPWSFVLTPWLTQIHAYEGDLVDKNQLNLFNKHSNITHLSLKVSQFTYPMLTMLTSIKSLSITDPDIAEYPTELFLKTFQNMTSLRRIEFLVTNGESSLDIAAKFPLKDVVLSTQTTRPFHTGAPRLRWYE